MQWQCNGEEEDKDGYTAMPGTSRSGKSSHVTASNARIQSDVSTGSLFEMRVSFNFDFLVSVKLLPD